MTTECLKPCFQMVRTTLAAGLLLVALPSSPTFPGPFEDGEAADAPGINRAVEPFAEKPNGGMLKVIE